MIGSKLELSGYSFEEEGRTYVSSLGAVVHDKPVKSISELTSAASALAVVGPVKTGEIKDGNRIDFDDKKIAENAVKEFEEMGFLIVPSSNLPKSVSSFTLEEMTVHLNDHFDLKEVK